MTVNVYLGAPYLMGWLRRRVQRITIQDAASGDYIFDAVVPCDAATRDSCLVIEGTVTYRD